MEISIEKGCRILSFAQHTRPLSREESLSCHTCFDTEYLGFCGLILMAAHLVALYDKQGVLKMALFLSGSSRVLKLQKPAIKKYQTHFFSQEKFIRHRKNALTTNDRLDYQFCDYFVTVEIASRSNFDGDVIGLDFFIFFAIQYIRIMYLTNFVS